MATSYLNLQVGGQLVTDMILNQVAVEQELNRHWWCRIQCRHLEDQRFPGILQGVAGQQSIIKVEEWLGKDLQVLAIENGGQQVIFDGFVLEVELVYELSGAYTAVIRGVTKSYKMDVTPRHEYYAEKKLKDVAEQLAQNAGLKATVQCQDKRALNYVQSGESDFEFLRRLVDDHGGWMRPSKDGIEIYDSFQQGTKVKWQKASEANALLSFSLKGRLASPSFNGAHYHFHKMQSEVYQGVSEEPQFFDSAGHLVDAVKKASKDAIPAGYLHQRNRVVTLDEYKDLLKKESVRSLGSSITGSGQTQNREVLPGNTVQVEGTLDADGKYGVTQVTHNWTPNGYTNEFSGTPWKNYTNARQPEMKPWNGLVPARVVDHNDPGKMGRIKVQYFWQEDSTAYWARMVTPHAGADRGFMFMPEVGDEVIVGFEDGDIERPIVLGCLWNGVDQAPRTGFWDKETDVSKNADLNANEVKRIVTKSGNRLQMVDAKGKEAIVLSTPNSATISLFTKTTETGREAIVLSVDKGDLFFFAPSGRIHFSCQYFTREVGFQ